MTHASSIQPHILFGIDDQISILNQLYNITLQTTRTQVELNQSWEALSQEEIQAQTDEES
jgi:hypothetical protein